MRIKFGPLESFKTKVVHFDEELHKDPWKLEIKLGVNYYQLIDALKRNKNISYANEVEKFGTKHFDSVRLSMEGKESQYVTGADDKALTVSVQGNNLLMPWKIISIGARATLAKGAVKDDDVEALLIAAVFFLANGDAADAEELFARASAKDPNAVKAAKLTLMAAGKPVDP